MDAKTVCLGLLSYGEASGYEIKKQLDEEPFRLFLDAGFGSIYPALKRLAADGLVTVRAQAQSSRPDKKTYSITPLGRLALLRTLERPPGPDRYRSDCLFMLHFADHLPARFLEGVIDQRIVLYRDLLRGIDDAPALDVDSGAGFAMGFGRAMYSAAIAYLEANKLALIGRALLNDRAAE